MAVLAYLSSAPGASTPADVGWLLMNVDWLSIGCIDVPSADQVHATRSHLEETQYLLAKGEASDAFEEVTAVHRRGYHWRKPDGSN